MSFLVRGRTVDVRALLVHRRLGHRRGSRSSRPRTGRSVGSSALGCLRSSAHHPLCWWRRLCCSCFFRFSLLLASGSAFNRSRFRSFVARLQHCLQTLFRAPGGLRQSYFNGNAPSGFLTPHLEQVFFGSSMLRSFIGPSSCPSFPCLPVRVIGEALFAKIRDVVAQLPYPLPLFLGDLPTEVGLPVCACPCGRALPLRYPRLRVDGAVFGLLIPASRAVPVRLG